MLRRCLLLCLVAIAQCRAEQSIDRLTAYLRQNRKELTIVDGRPAGPGGDWLRTQTAAARFTFFGEGHDVAEVPRFLTALWPDLARAGYRHVAIEAGQWLANRLDRYARFRDRDALAAFHSATLPRRPTITVPPASMEDIGFVESLSGSQPGPLSIVWGVDHEFKLAPLLRRLQVLIKDRASRSQVEHLLTKVETAEGAGRYDPRAFQADIEQLTARLSQNRDSEISFLVDALRRSLVQARPMKQLFLREYRAAQQAGEREPRVLLRLGSHHGKRGLISDFGTSTLGNFVAELAVAEDAEFLNIFFVSCAHPSLKGMPAGARPCREREAVWLAAFTDVATAQLDCLRSTPAPQ